MSQYFENDKTLKDNQKIIDITFNNKKYLMYTNNGLFCKDHLDYGTKLLLEELTSKELTGNILDLGCGYGAIGIILSSIYPKTKVDMVDITDLAINTATQNVKLNKISNANIFKSDIYSNINKKYDYIVTNPPIRAGKEVIRKFLITAVKYLKSSGQLWFVMRKDHGVKSILKELEPYYEIKIINKSKGFYITCAIPNQKIN